VEESPETGAHLSGSQSGKGKKMSYNYTTARRTKMVCEVQGPIEEKKNHARGGMFKRNFVRKTSVKQQRTDLQNLKIYKQKKSWRYAEQDMEI